MELIPKIDCKNLHQFDSKVWNFKKNQIDNALVYPGFMFLTNHGISTSTVKALKITYQILSKLKGFEKFLLKIFRSIKPFTKVANFSTSLNKTKKNISLIFHRVITGTQNLGKNCEISNSKLRSIFHCFYN